MIQSVFIELYYVLIRIASIRSKKAKQWLDGRKQNPKNSNGLSNTCLIHCASYGEYEQAFPFIKAYKEKYPEQSILLSFFSPSGFEKIKKPEFVDQKIYLPRDRFNDVNTLLSEFNIQKLILVKYEFWPKLIQASLKRKVELYLISTRFEKNHPIFRFYFKKVNLCLKQFKQIFVIDKASLELLKDNGFNNVHIAGDTRFDKVLLNKENKVDFNLKSSKMNFVFGSIWKSDWLVLKENLTELSKEYRFIFAPHEATSENISFFQKELKELNLEVGLWSKKETSSHILIDTIGDLKYLYGVSDISYIGGGYGKGLHNILEALVFSRPCIIGPEYSRFPEVVTAVSEKVTVPIKDQKLLDALEVAKRIDSKSIDNFINEHTGASKRILDLLA